MAELDIGRHCGVSHCKQLDFLPVVCHWCKQTFCREHSAAGEHACPTYASAESTGEYSGPRAFSCSVVGCTQRELQQVVCEACSLNFCLRHRHQADHGCSRLVAPPDRMAGTREHVQRILDKQEKKTRKAPRSQKTRATAAKVAFMKLKQKASGDRGVSDTERVYLNVLLPLSAKDAARPLFFSKKWSIGRLIDYAADAARIKNMNNVAGAKKLRLFDADEGTMFATDVTLESLMREGDGGILNGGSVILEYVDEGVSCIHDMEKYMNR